MTSPGGEGKSVRRGEVYVADLAPFGGQLFKNRPVLVVQNDLGNQRSAETIVLTIRSDSGKRFAMLVPAARGEGGLHRDSLIDAGHILTLPKSGLGRRVGAMPSGIMTAVNEALRVSLGLV